MSGFAVRAKRREPFAASRIDGTVLHHADVEENAVRTDSLQSLKEVRTGAGYARTGREIYRRKVKYVFTTRVDGHSADSEGVPRRVRRAPTKSCSTVSFTKVIGERRRKIKDD